MNTHAQFGFRKYRSTELALFEPKKLVQRSFERKKFALGTFVYFTKVFDYLSHNLPLGKLDIYGIRGQALLLLKSYLDQRKQFANLHGLASSTKAPVYHKEEL